ncbi:class I glutamine amidotransferase-like protein [Dunaliella salina]|uniref:Class I glutamine amidotransferase-like protein n=1 Tax=Dunaliella salina TaxID=3046 RepID=A0ABQ7HAF1_DUNSA|nr:class I glutamine amidotransferase-like protein [Dunaliella salina]|eukprot:KAF5843826.1 class I glutamine amidotransferase-like protein [Dunaliella salina]
MLFCLQVFSVPKHDFPTTEEVRQADLVILGGGKYSANGEEEWMRKLLSPDCLPAWVQTGTKHIGCCLGHQALAKALGGKIGPNPSGRFVLKVEDVEYDKAACASCGLLAALPSQQGSGEGPLAPYKFVESHGECVTALPPGSQLLAKSGTAAVEMWRYGSNVLAFQYHPELHPSMALEKIHPAVSSIGRLDEIEQRESARSLKERPPDVECMAAVLSHYRDHGLVSEQGATDECCRRGAQVEPTINLQATSSSATR